MKLKVIADGCYPGNVKILSRLVKGEKITPDEYQRVEVRAGQTIDGSKLDKRIVKSLLANGIAEPFETAAVARPSIPQDERTETAEAVAEEVSGDG